MTAIFIVKFGSDWVKTVGGVAFLHFPAAYMVLC